MSACNTTNLVGSAGEVLKKNVKDLLADGLFSDFAIVCGDKEFKVHRAILYTQSKYFKSILGGEFRVSTTTFMAVSTPTDMGQEAKATIIPLPEDPEIFHAVIYFLYNSAWCPGMTEPTKVVAV